MRSLYIMKDTQIRAMRSLLLVGVTFAGFSLAGCGKVDRMATVASTIPDSIQERHPIVLTDAPHTVDLFPAGQQFDKTQQLRVRQFASMYRELGRGPITVLVPNIASSRHSSTQVAISGIRRTLAQAGVGGNLRVTQYTPDNANVASPLRLTFMGTKAKVATRCGEWPDDLGSASSLDGWQNKQYWNYGCSHQNMLAAQVADPRDLAGPRGETEADVNMRMRAIGNVRKGTDPGTKWQVKNTTIGGVGG